MVAWLFDLDNTLVNSSALKSLRNAGMWSQVMANLHLIRPFGIPGQIQPHQLPGHLRGAGNPVGIITASPEMYAKQVLQDFQIPYDALVTYHDTTNHKPDPEPLQLAISRLNADPKTSIYFGDDAVDVEAAYHAGVVSIGAGWGIANKAELAGTVPELILYSADICLPYRHLARRKYVGECATLANLDWHDGSVVHINGVVPTFALGRYFTAGDPRHARHAWTKTIIDHKREEAPAREIAEKLAIAIQNLGYSRTHRYVVGVPPKPSKPRDRIGEVLGYLPQFISRPEVLPNSMTCTREFRDLKTLGPLERQTEVRGAFRTGYQWHKNNIVLVDDVLTTGSTTEECIRVLKASGAADVALIVFGKDQRTFSRKLCPACNRPMKVRTNRGDGSKFWGCSGYPEHCRKTESI